MLEDLYPGLGQGPFVGAMIFKRWLERMRDEQMGYEKEAKLMQRLANRMAGCHRCALRDNCEGVFYGDQHVRSDLMIVGSHPEQDDLEHSQLFYGESGKVLFGILEEIGALTIKRWEPFTYTMHKRGIFLTTTVKCPPASGKKPHVDEIKKCLPWLGKQIGLVKPRVIVALGNVPLSALTGKALTKCRISRESGAMVLAPDKQTFLMPTWDPGYVVHRAEKSTQGGLRARAELKADLQEAWRAVCRAG